MKNCRSLFVQDTSADDDDEHVREVVLDGVDGGTLTLVRPEDGSELHYTATLRTTALAASIDVYDPNSMMTNFLQSLTHDWSDPDETREWHSVEGEISIKCRHDGHGTIYCNVSLQYPHNPPTRQWRACAVLGFGVGAHTARLQEELRAFFAADV